MTNAAETGSRAAFTSAPSKVALVSNDTTYLDVQAEPDLSLWDTSLYKDY